MNSYFIGIMQGRLLPENLDKLQIFPRNKWFEEIEIAKSIGFQHIELLWDKKKEIKKTKSLIDTLGSLSMPFTKSICIDSICYTNSIDEVLDEIFDVLLTFKENTPKVLVIPLLNNIKFQSVPKLRKLISELYIHKLFDLINLYKVKLALEINLPAFKVMKALKLDQLEIFGICIDTGNLWYCSNSPLQEIQTFSNKIIHIHVKDRDKDGNNVLLGDGLVNFYEFFGILKKINYSKIFTLETKYFKKPINEAKKNFLYICNIIEEK